MVRNLECLKIKTLQCTVVRITYKILFFIWFGLIVFFSVVPNSTGDQSFLAKMALTSSGFFQHVFGYFVLSALAFFAFEKTEDRGQKSEDRGRRKTEIRNQMSEVRRARDKGRRKTEIRDQMSEVRRARDRGLRSALAGRP
jgi:membrane protein implicated in regulation of membrane protease activity